MSSENDSPFCATPLWDSDLSWSPTRPDLTECFHSTVPLLAPCAFLWLFLPYFIRMHLKTNEKLSGRHPFRVQVHFWSRLMVLKTLCLTLSFAATLSYLMQGLYNDEEVKPASRSLVPVVFMLTLFLNAGCTVISQRAHRLSSPPLFYFWLLLVILGAPTFAASVRVVKELRDGGDAAAMHTKHDEFRAILRISMYTLWFALAVLTGMAEPPKTAAEEALKRLEKAKEEEEAQAEAEETNLRVTGKSQRVNSAKAARQARRAREKAKKHRRALAIKIAQGRLEGRDMDEMVRRYAGGGGKGDEPSLAVQSTGQRKMTAEERASPVSALFFTWLDPVIWAGFRAPPLKVSQVPEVKGEMAPSAVRKKFDRWWRTFARWSRDKVKKQKSKEAKKAAKEKAKKDKARDNPSFVGDSFGVTFAGLGGNNGLNGQKEEAKEVEDKFKPPPPPEDPKVVNVVWPLFAAFGTNFAASMLFKVVQDLLKFVSPQLLKLLIKFVQSDDGSSEEPGSWRGYFLACALFVVNLLQLLVLQQYWIKCYQTGMEMRTAVVGAIYKKSLRLSNEARRSYNLGEIVNLVSTDAATLQETLPQLNMVWSMPLQIILALYFLYQELGVALLSGVAVLLLLIPFNTVTERMGAKLERSRMRSKDRRIRAMYEILNGIRVIKCNAWEDKFSENASSIRQEELGFLRKKYTLTSFGNFVFGSVPVLITLCSFGTYVATGEDHVLTADKVFVCISLFNLLRLPMHLLPWGISSAVRYWVSARRISKFLSARELEKPAHVKGANLATYGGSEGDLRYAVKIKNGYFSWGAETAPEKDKNKNKKNDKKSKKEADDKSKANGDIELNGGIEDKDAAGEDLSEKDAEERRVILHDIDLHVPRGSLVAVVGRVGAGKSTLLASILDETERLSGTLSVRCKGVAYVSQQPWIQNMSVKRNILFGSEHKQEWYHRVTESCALLDDFAQLSDGEETLIGENGINLSGGQKQRVAIARAAYRRDKADLFLFDDPLSALDSHTGNHVFKHVMSNDGILSDATRILVTHRRNIVSKADYVLVMRDGHISDFGAPTALMSAGSELSVMLEDIEDEKQVMQEEKQKEHEQVSKQPSQPPNPDDVPTMTEEDAETAKEMKQQQEQEQKDAEADIEDLPISLSPSSSHSSLASSSDKGSEHSGSDKDDDDEDDDDKDESETEEEKEEKVKKEEEAPKVEKPLAVTEMTMQQPLMAATFLMSAKAAAEKRLKDEEVMSGRVKAFAYRRYLRAVGYLTSVVILIIFLANQAISTGSTVWLAAWSDHATAVHNLDSPASSFDNGFYLGVLAGFGLAQALLSFCRNFFMYSACVRAAGEIHSSLLSATMRARMRYFDTTPTGSIVNRFSADMNVVDRELPQSLNSFLFTLVEVLSVMVVISVSFPVFAAVILPLAVLYYFLLRVYIPASRQIKRFESATKSPINLHFSESVQGAQTIRAFGERDRFTSESENLVESNLRHAYAAAMCRRWLSLRSELTGNAVVLLAALLAVFYRSSVSAGWVGLTVSFAMSITETFNWVLLNGSQVEEKAVAVERIREAEKHTPSERDWRRPSQDPKEAKWLNQGRLKLTDVSLAYAHDLPAVLHNISLSVEPGERIGVCGRTGAGKSSLAAALFALSDAWTGKIEMDGVDVRRIGLHTLRSQLTIIPQDPVLFNRSVRENVDPVGASSDEQIWKALEQSQMKAAISDLKGGLDHTVEEGGANFSVGQRQLLCLARALLRDSAIVMLDEATASMDEDTDAGVQETLLSELSGRTVITIAHRLDTILDYDRILVLDQGRVAEFDTPDKLIADRHSQFHAMMRQHNEQQH